MPLYYVCKKAQEDGTHEVHRSTCGYLASEKNRTYLGSYADCHEAVTEAKKIYDKIDGCFYCCFAFHKK